jgi:hypothetical protein
MGLWNRSFGRDPSVIGRTLLADGDKLEIIGVMPEALEAEGAIRHLQAGLLHR